jgi:hypothetical protein
MPVIIKKRTVPIESRFEPKLESKFEPILEGTPIKISTPIVHLPKSETNIPRGRGYLRTEINDRKPKKRLEQLLPRVYNTPIEKKDVKGDFEDSDLAYYSPYKCIDCKDTKKIMVYDTCESCDGTGCRQCNNTGEVRNFIPCQACNKVKRYG